MPPFTLERLPNEILGFIFLNLDSTELLPVALTSKRLYSAAKDNQLWAKYCKQILNEIHFPQDLISIPSDGYVKEYIYQNELDRYVEHLIRSLSDSYIPKIVIFQKIICLGLRAKRALDKIVNDPNYTQFNIQQRYFASQISKSVLYCQTIMSLYNMFHDSDDLDFFKIYLKLDAFSNDPDAAAHSEKFYDKEINVVKAALAGVKHDFKSQGGNYNGDNVSSTVQRLTNVLERLNLSHDFFTIDQHIRETRKVENLIPQSLLSGVFGTYKKTQKFGSPLYMALGAAICKYFAEWIGLKVTLVPLKLNLYLRVDNPNYNSWTPEDEEYYKGRELPKCIYVDATRNNKVRSHRELEEIAKILNIPMVSPQKIPSPHLSMQVFIRDISTFISNIWRFDGPSIQFGEEYLGALFCAYAFGAAAKAKKNNINARYNNLKSTFRVDIEKALDCGEDGGDSVQLFENGEKISKLFKSAELQVSSQSYFGSLITFSKLFNMIQEAANAKPLLCLGVVTEVVIPFAPKSLSNDMKHEVLFSIKKKFSIQKSIKKGRFINQGLDLKDHSHDNHHDYEFLNGKQSKMFDPSKVVIGSAVRYYGLKSGLGIVMNVDNRESRFHDERKRVFFEVLLENGTTSVLREENVSNLCREDSTFHHLLKINKQFFGIDAGIHFKSFNEKQKRFILA
jgi:hypothetical protein